MKSVFIPFFGTLFMSLLPVTHADSTATASGDRHPNITAAFPESAFFENGGNVLDITKAPFNAKGDGITDDTHAFVKAYDFILREQDKVGYSATAMLNTGIIRPNPEGYPSDGPIKRKDASYIIFIPKGEYLVSDTIIYSMADRTPSKRRDTFFKRGKEQVLNSGWERLIWVRFVGENRKNTIIRLKDNAKGFEAGAEKAVLAFGKSPFNNRKGMNAVRNLTINTGVGNAGAVGIDFTGANSAELNNLTITSSGESGAVGILFKRPPVIGRHSDITINGFDVGLSSRVGHACAPVMEYLTLSNQKKTGILLAEKKENEGGHGQAMLVVRKLLSQNSVPAVTSTVEGGHMIIVDAELIRQATHNFSNTVPAIHMAAGELFARHIKTSGYSTAVLSPLANKSLTEDYISEYVTSNVVASEGQAKKSLNIGFVEPPSFPNYTDPNDWATPEMFGAKADGTTDDTKAIQAAFDSGKPMIFLARARYVVSDNIKVPATVKHINGLFRHNSSLTFDIAEDGTDPIFIQDMYRGQLLHNAKRDVVRKMGQIVYENTIKAKGSTLFSFGGSYPRYKKNPARIDFYGWSVNNEGKGLPLVCDGATAVIFGFKVERGPVLKVINGGSMEMLGATIGVRTPAEDAIVNIESNLTVVANKSAGAYEDDADAITETLSGKTTIFKAQSLPLRKASEKGFPFIPLYVGRK